MKPLKPATARRRFAAMHSQYRIALDTLNGWFERTSKALKARCPHDWEYHPDPSGNNDSGYCCTICHEERRRLP